MENTEQCESSNIMVKGQMHTPKRKPSKLNQICPIQLLEKELDLQSRPKSFKQKLPKINVQSNSVFLPGREKKISLEQVLHIRPTFHCEFFLKSIDIVAEICPPFTVKKIRGFPTSKYEIIDTASQKNTFELSSNFMGSQYILTRGNITHLTINFLVGCGNEYRVCNVFRLKQQSRWELLEGVERTQDLSELYQLSSNFDHIAKYTSLEPRKTESGAYIMHFSRKAIIPSVENMIVCNLNGQRLVELAKVSENGSLFQVSMQKNLPMEMVLSIVTASLDFKLGIE